MENDWKNQPSNLPPNQMTAHSAPAQSDAPSAESASFSEWFVRTKKFAVEDVEAYSPQNLIKHAEAYAALRTARQDAELEGATNAITTLNELIARQAAKVAQLERERDAYKCDYESEHELTEAVRKAGGTTWQYIGKNEPILFLNIKAHEAESALSEARERTQALADWLEWKQRHSAECAQQCGEQGSDQLKTFNLGMVDCVQSVIQTDEYRQLRQLLTSGASGAAGKGGVDAEI